MNTSTRSTPGPWIVGEELNSGSLPVYQALAGARMQVARVNGRSGEMEANARLIAAAPELLAALRGLAAGILGDDICWCSSPVPSRSHTPRCAAARHAVAAAVAHS